MSIRDFPLRDHQFANTKHTMSGTSHLRTICVFKSQPTVNTKSQESSHPRLKPANACPTRITQARLPPKTSRQSDAFDPSDARLTRSHRARQPQKTIRRSTAHPTCQHRACHPSKTPFVPTFHVENVGCTSMQTSALPYDVGPHHTQTPTQHTTILGSRSVTSSARP